MEWGGSKMRATDELPETVEPGLNGHLWHAVALRLQRDYLRRDRQARAFARRWRRLVNASRERDEKYRAQIEALKARQE